MHPVTDPAVPPSVRDQLLGAALAAASEHGIARLSMGDVAKRAGLSRQTLYRYFPSKDELVAEVVRLETAQLIEVVIGAASQLDDAGDALEAGLLAALVVMRDHPLLDRLLRTEPEALLPLITSDGGPVMTMVRSVVDGILAERTPGLDPVALRRLADLVTRLLISYAVAAPDDPPEVVAQFVARFVTRGLDPLTATA
jgi:AcrR family transcriptional regulator